MSYESPFPSRNLPGSLIVSDFEARLDRLMGGRLNGPRLIGVSEQMRVPEALGLRSADTAALHSETPSKAPFSS
jgi:hypothetical protein